MLISAHYSIIIHADMDDSQSTAAPALIGCQGLEQFLLLTKTARGTAAVELIQRVLEAPGVYVFGELLETECVKELAGGTNANYVQLLELFAYGTYKEYKRKIFEIVLILVKLGNWFLCRAKGITTSVNSTTVEEIKTLNNCIISC